MSWLRALGVELWLPAHLERQGGAQINAVDATPDASRNWRGFIGSGKTALQVTISSTLLSLKACAAHSIP